MTRIKWPFADMKVGEPETFYPPLSHRVAVALRTHCRRTGDQFSLKYPYSELGKVVEIVKVHEGSLKAEKRVRWPFSQLAVGEVARLENVPIPRAQNALGVIKCTTGKKFATRIYKENGATIFEVKRLADNSEAAPERKSRSWPFSRMVEGAHTILPLEDAKAALNALRQVQHQKRWTFKYAETTEGLLVKRMKNKHPDAAPMTEVRSRKPANKWPWAGLNIGESGTVEINSADDMRLAIRTVKLVASRFGRSFKVRSQKGDDGIQRLTVTRGPNGADVTAEA